MSVCLSIRLSVCLFKDSDKMEWDEMIVKSYERKEEKREGGL